MAERLKRLGFLPKPWNLAFVNANQALGGGEFLSLGSLGDEEMR